MIEIAYVVMVCFICYLILCAVVVLRTGSTKGLRDVAHAVHALRKFFVIRR
ncbi:hypothetical protein LRS71_23525 [Rhodococcus pyridinivorans]|uniref:hypothetical protein n=1 Tax=Rhodococcus pyridinivorans TaxID=103816 RepID=UPI001E2A2CC8|nr:hypothetical protein [Rhodococcus pyridinivorans]MCD5422487.1 hypothetical protein [Rhodococcus pyridinivorans]